MKLSPNYTQEAPNDLNQASHFGSDTLRQWDAMSPKNPKEDVIAPKIDWKSSVE